MRIIDVLALSFQIPGNQREKPSINQSKKEEKIAYIFIS